MRRGDWGNICAEASGGAVRGRRPGRRKGPLLALEERYRDAARKATNRVDLGTDTYGVHFGGGWGSTPPSPLARRPGPTRPYGERAAAPAIRSCSRPSSTSTGRGALASRSPCPRGPTGTFSNRDRPALLDYADTFEEARVGSHIAAAGPDDVEDGCRRPGGMCRVTGAGSGAMGPMKRTRPNRLGTTREGLRPLGRLRARGGRVYPFDAPGPRPPARRHPRHLGASARQPRHRARPLAPRPLTAWSSRSCPSDGYPYDGIFSSPSVPEPLYSRRGRLARVSPYHSAPEPYGERAFSAGYLENNRRFGRLLQEGFDIRSRSWGARRYSAT
jgi:hypothetical protein